MVLYCINLFPFLLEAKRVMVFSIPFDLLSLYRACRKTPLRETGASWPASARSTGAALTVLSVPIPVPPYLAARTRSRIHVFRLTERIDRGPALSSVCHRRSLGVLNPYGSVFRVPMMP